MVRIALAIDPFKQTHEDDGGTARRNFSEGILPGLVTGIEWI
jgi:hypothetical protein